MSLSKNTDWMVRAFLQAKAALISEIATPSGAFISEDYVRSALLRGLMLSEPTKAARVKAEMPVTWTKNPCLLDGQSISTGSPLRHDVGVEPQGDDPGMVCEVKWLKQQKAKALEQDIWKLALTRSTTPEMRATRTFLCVGGHADALGGTLATIRKNGLDLRWSTNGRAHTRPGDKILDLGKPATKGGPMAGALESLVGWGRKNDRHFRTPPPTRQKYKLTLRDRWFLTVGERSWRIVLWELHCWGVRDNTRISWTDVRKRLLGP